MSDSIKCRVLIRDGKWRVPVDQRPDGWEAILNETDYVEAEAQTAEATTETPILNAIIEGEETTSSIQQDWNDLACQLRRMALGWEGEQELYHSVLVLFAPLFTGEFDPESIAKMTGVSRIEVDRYGSRFLDQGVWHDGSVYLGEYLDDKSKQWEADIELLLLAGVGTGIFVVGEKLGVYNSPKIEEATTPSGKVAK